MIPNRAHVEAAIAEFKDLGIKAFLLKHAGGYYPKSHYAIIDNNRYPMKALWKAALIQAGNSRTINTSHARNGLKRLGYRDFWPVYPPVDVVHDPVDLLVSQAIEGERYLREVEVIRRSKKIVIAAKERWSAVCMACNFDFEKTYGPLGKGYIECHHIDPISGGEGKGRVTKVEDLTLLCSNCHRMVHKKRPCLAINDLKNIIEQR